MERGCKIQLENSTTDGTFLRQSDIRSPEELERQSSCTSLRRGRKMNRANVPQRKKPNRSLMGKRDGPYAEEQDGLDDRSQLGKLIQSATTSPLLHLDDHALACIKSLVRASDRNVHAAFEFLLDRLKKNHSQVRYLTVLLIDELFARSKLFRSLLVPRFETFIVLSIGFRADCPLPPPEDRAELLRTKSIQLVEKWKDTFGQHYKPIRLAYDYLKTTVRLDFPNIREAATLAAQQREEREERTQGLLREKVVILKKEYPNLKAEVQSTLDEIDACLKILADEECNSDGAVDIDNAEDSEEYGVESLRRLRDIAEFQPVLQESMENLAVVDNVRDLYKLLTTRDLVKSQDWLATLMRVDPQDERQSRDVLLRDIIDLRNNILATKAKCEGLGIQKIEGHFKAAGEGRGEGDDDDDIVWEQGDVPVTDDFAVASSEGPSVSSGTTSAAISAQNKICLGGEERKGSTGKKERSSVKQELLKQAPVLPWGTFLDRWGSESAVPANARGLEYENHWGRVDYDVMIPAEKIAEATIRTSYYTPPKVEIRACLAPLRNGGLCRRRDIKRCPLHGPVIPRDENGDPISDQLDLRLSPGKREVEVMAEEKADCQNDTVEVGADPAQLIKQAIANVRRGQVDVVARKKRAKIAREHNEACLKDAATRTIGVSFGEALAGPSNQELVSNASARKPRGGLTALLRKKPTSKDRLARRLLNGRVRETAAEQLRRDEEAAYRQSFPNQWTMK